MTTRIDVLDHGYVQHVDTWGSEEGVIAAARMSTGKGFLGWGNRCKVCKASANHSNTKCECGNGTYEAGDEKLLRFLWENDHSTPFEMAGMTIEVQGPIFMFREFQRHRVPFGYSERSARYTPLPNFNYVPTVERMMLNSKTNKQAGTIADCDELTADVAAALISEEHEINALLERFYQKKLKAGVSKELARTHLGVSRYSCMRATANLRGWLAFLKLRQAPNAQYEIRVFADAVGVMISEAFPRTWELFNEKRKTP